MIFSIIASGCTASKIFEPVINTKLVTAKVPKSVRRCADKPLSPNMDKRTQKAVAILIAKLDHAHANCKANLKVVDRILTRQEAKINAFNAREEAKQKEKLKN